MASHWRERRTLARQVSGATIHQAPRALPDRQQAGGDCIYCGVAVSQCSIEPEGAAAIADALGSNDSLELLDLRFCDIGIEGAAALAAVLVRCLLRWLAGWMAAVVMNHHPLARPTRTRPCSISAYRPVDLFL